MFLLYPHGNLVTNNFDFTTVTHKSFAYHLDFRLVEEMPVVLKLPGMVSSDVDDYVAARSLSINARDVTVQEVIRLLTKYDVPAEDVQRVVKVDGFRVEVLLRTGEAVERLWPQLISPSRYVEKFSMYRTLENRTFALESIGCLLI